MLARRAACNQLRLGDAIRRNVYTVRFNKTKRRVYLERHSGDVTRVNTALATLGRVHFALVTIATMPPLVHNLLLCATDAQTRFSLQLTVAQCSILRYKGMKCKN